MSININDNDGDSQMQSSPEASDNELFPDADNPITPLNQVADLSSLSPPDSHGGVSLQQHSNMPTAASGAAIANSNGKRPIQTLDGTESMESLAMTNGTGMSREGGVPHGGKTDMNSGYTWYKAEDEPGYSWMNKKAMDEANRAYEMLQDKDKSVSNRYGDPFEMADNELAILNSKAKQ